MKTHEKEFYYDPLTGEWYWAIRPKASANTDEEVLVSFHDIFLEGHD